MHTILESVWSGGVGADLDGGDVDDDDVVAGVSDAHNC